MKTDLKKEEPKNSKLTWLYFGPVVLFLPAFILLVLGLCNIGGSTLQWLCAGGLALVGVLAVAALMAISEDDPYGY
jgi:uncharacterized membrane protein